jgi:transmembrane protein EpsG
MTVMWLHLLFVFVCAAFARMLPLARRETAALAPADGAAQALRPNKLLVAAAAASFVLVSGLRSNIGDTPFYMYNYYLLNPTFEGFRFEGDFGFSILSILLKKLTPDPQALIFVTALVTNVLIVWGLYRYSRLIEVSLFLYITTGMFTVSMNGIRQFLAAAILFAGTHWLIKGDWRRYFPLVLLAATFHNTAIIMLIFYFLVRKRAWTRATVLLSAFALLVAVGYDQFFGILLQLIEGSKYTVYGEFDEGGANVIRVAIAGIPLLIAFLGRHKLRRIWPESDVFVNMTLLGFLFMVVSLNNWIFARFNIYFSLYGMALWSWLFPLFAERYRKLVYFGTLVFYLMYFYYEHVVALDLQYRSHYL